MSQRTCSLVAPWRQAILNSTIGEPNRLHRIGVKPGAMAQVLLLIALAVVPSVGEAIVFRQKISWRSRIPASEIVDLDLVRSWGSNVMWLDARPDNEYQEDHIPNAISLNEDRWNEHLPQFLEQCSPDKKVV